MAEKVEKVKSSVETLKRLILAYCIQHAKMSLIEVSREDFNLQVNGLSSKEDLRLEKTCSSTFHQRAECCISLITIPSL